MSNTATFSRHKYLHIVPVGPVDAGRKTPNTICYNTALDLFLLPWAGNEDAVQTDPSSAQTSSCACLDAIATIPFCAAIFENVQADDPQPCRSLQTYQASSDGSSHTRHNVLASAPDITRHRIASCVSRCSLRLASASAARLRKVAVNALAIDSSSS